MIRFEPPEPDGWMYGFQVWRRCGFQGEPPGGIPFLLPDGLRAWFRFWSRALQPDVLWRGLIPAESWCGFQDAQPDGILFSSRAALRNEFRSLFRAGQLNEFRFAEQQCFRLGWLCGLQSLRWVLPLFFLLPRILRHSAFWLPRVLREPHVRRVRQLLC